MSVTITLHQVTSVITGPRYQLVNTVTASTNIDMNVFVFSVKDDSFNRFATVYDLENFPADKPTAISEGLDFYRGLTFTRSWPTIQNALADKDVSQDRLTALCKDWQVYSSGFPASTTTTLTS